jgi:anti-sigma B factor antagonist
MEVSSRKVGDVVVVQLAGELTAQTAGPTQEQVLRLVAPEGKMILDLAGLSFMSSAGLRLLLLLYRTIRGRGGKILLVGLSEELRTTMALTGFLDLFHHHPTLEAGLAELNPGPGRETEEGRGPR